MSKCKIAVFLLAGMFAVAPQAVVQAAGQAELQIEGSSDTTASEDGTVPENETVYENETASADENIFEDGDVVGFIGDSITHVNYTNDSYVSVLKNYYTTRYPYLDIEFRNLGIAGAVAGIGLDTYSYDPLYKGINRAVLFYGINDLGFEYYLDPVSYSASEAERNEKISQYDESINQLIDRLESSGIQSEDITCVLSSPYGQSNESNLDSEGQPVTVINQGLEDIATQLAEIVEERQTGFLDFYHPLLTITEDMQEKDAAAVLTLEDNIHPSQIGQILMGVLYLQQQGCAGEVASVSIQEDGSAVASNAVVQQVIRTSDYVLFGYQPASLPMAVTQQYREANGIYSFLEDLNREILQVEGLEADHYYELYMDGENLGEYLGEEFAQGLNIADLHYNPNQLVAREIQDLNVEQHMREIEYRSFVQHSTSCGSGENSKAEVISAYKEWKTEDDRLQAEMQKLARDASETIRQVTIIKAGVPLPESRVGAGAEDEVKDILIIDAIILIILISAAYIWYLKKKEEKRF